MPHATFSPDALALIVRSSEGYLRRARNLCLDYHGSRLVVLQRLRWPTTATVTRTRHFASTAGRCAS
jgi:hypothetical protein